MKTKRILIIRYLSNRFTKKPCILDIVPLWLTTHRQELHPKQQLCLNLKLVELYEPSKSILLHLHLFLSSTQISSREINQQTSTYHIENWSKNSMLDATIHLLFIRDSINHYKHINVQIQQISPELKAHIVAQTSHHKKPIQKFSAKSFQQKDDKLNDSISSKPISIDRKSIQRYNF